MQVSLSTVAGLERRLEVAVPAERVAAEIENRFKDIARTARLKGFRPGKAPLAVVRQQYASQVQSEVVGDLLRDSYAEAVSSQNLKPATDPRIEQLSAEPGAELRYVALIEVMPEFTLNPVSDLKVDRPSAEITDADLEAMCNRTRVVLTTVGPYQLYGDKLVAACVKTGTDYADLCGEPAWMAEKIAEHQAAAEKSGARICFSSGFDSIPFDLGVMMTQKACIDKFGKPAPRIRGRVRAMQGTFSGGTAASLGATMKAAAKNVSIINVLRNPFALTPGFEGPDQPSGMIPSYEDDLGKWSAPFVMAPINTKNVHRTNFLLGHAYGRDFVYDEMIMTTLGDAGRAMAEAISSVRAFKPATILSMNWQRSSTLNADQAGNAARAAITASAASSAVPCGTVAITSSVLAS